VSIIRICHQTGKCKFAQAAHTQEKVPSNSAFSCGGRAWHQQGFDPSDPEKVDFVGGFRDIQITLFPF
jgi:hypothetical protein